MMREEADGGSGTFGHSRPFYASGQASVPRISTESELRDALQCSGLEEVQQPRDRCDEADGTKGGS